MKKRDLTEEEIQALFPQGRAEADSVAGAPVDLSALAALGVEAASFPSLEPTSDQPADPSALGMLADVDLEVTVTLGQTYRSIREILALGTGSVVQLDRLAGDAVDVLVNGRMVAKAEVVVIGENFGVRIVELVNGTQRKPR